MANKSLDGNLVKRAHTRESYTDEQLLQLAKCTDRETGPDYFINNFFWIQHPRRGRIPYKAYEYQTRLLSSYHDHRFSCNLMPRQTGKTTTAAGYILWYAMFIPDSAILIAAHKYAGSQEIMQRIRYSYEDVPDHIRPGVYSYNKGSIDFDNGSRIISTTTTENTGRGMALSMLYLDEFAFVKPSIAREFWTSISPTLATGGKAIITSTPNSDEDQFAMIWRQANKTIDDAGNETNIGRNGFFAFRSYWNEHPERDAQWKAEELGRIGEERFAREHDCEFIINDETLIDSRALSILRPSDVLEKHGQVRWFDKPRKGHNYLVSLDPSLGTGGDNAAIQVFEIPTMKQVAEWMHNKTPVQGQVRILRDITNYIVDTIDHRDESQPAVWYSIENNTLGEAALVVIDDLGEQQFGGVFLTETRKHGNTKRYRKGFNTTHKNKLLACSRLKNLVETDKITLRSKNLISELKTYIARGQSYAAKDGETDDLVAATLLIIRMSYEVRQWDTGLFDRLKDGMDQEHDMPMPFIIV
jgi:hypothetical protein